MQVLDEIEMAGDFEAMERNREAMERNRILSASDDMPAPSANAYAAPVVRRRWLERLWRWSQR